MSANTDYYKAWWQDIERFRRLPLRDDHRMLVKRATEDELAEAVRMCEVSGRWQTLAAELLMELLAERGGRE